jgi:hypothetical protein
MAIWDIFEHLVHYVLILYTFSGFGIMYQEKSGNPDSDPSSVWKGRFLDPNFQY